MTVARWLDGSIHLLAKGKEIRYQEIEPGRRQRGGFWVAEGPKSPRILGWI